MQALEISVLVVFAVIAAGLIMAFLLGFDFQDFQEMITRLLLDEEKNIGLERVSFNGFLNRVYSCWQTCLTQDPDILAHYDCGTVYLESLPGGLSTLDAGFLQDQMATVNYCQDCNVTVKPESIPIPAALNLDCIVSSQSPQIVVRYGSSEEGS